MKTLTHRRLVGRRGEPGAGGSPRGRAFHAVTLRTDVLTVGWFRASPSDCDFQTAGPIDQPTFVFPRTSVWIQHEGSPAFVADPTTMTCYNRRQPYLRRRLSEAGDDCDWFEIRPALLREIVRPEDPRRADGEDLFAFSHCPCDADSYLWQQLVVRHIATSSHPDLLYVEETMLQILARCLRRAYRWRDGEATPSRSGKRKDEIALHARQIVAKRFAENLSLSQLSHEVGCSVFHLCRSFRQHFRTTIHGYRNQLRLRASIGQVTGFESGLTDIALGLGYSSHSHFTHEFRRVFGRPPSSLRHSGREEGTAAAEVYP